MDKRINILVFGMGRRIRDDLIPVLNLIGLENFNLFFIKKRATIEPWQKPFQVQIDFEEIESLDNFDYVFICVPPTEVINCFRLVRNFRFDGTILIDTPVFFLVKNFQ